MLGGNMDNLSNVMIKTQERGPHNPARHRVDHESMTRFGRHTCPI